MNVMHALYRLNGLRWYFRLPTKWAILLATVLIVCFPYPGRLVKHIAHWMNPNALVDPEAPALQPYVEELRSRMPADVEPRQALRLVERFVYEKVPYEWDWNTWGTADYLPTVAEVLAKGKEDCDGRAVLAASLLRRLGYDARLVTDLAHMWVKTAEGEAMAPGKKQAIEATDRGWSVHAEALGQMPKALAFGLAVFPLGRELIVVLVAWLLLLRRGAGAVRTFGVLALLFAGLLLLRTGSQNYYEPTPWLQWSGVAALGAGVAVLWIGTGANQKQDRRSEEPRTG